MTDEFDFLDQAEPVTSDSDDSIESGIEQCEADELRSAAGTDGVETTFSDTDTKTQFDPAIVAECRYCKVYFHTYESVHKHDCPQQPVASCRYCKEDHVSTQDANDHLYHCEDFRRAREQQIRQSRAKTMRGGDDPQIGHFIDPAYHEFKGYFKYDCSDRRNALRSYFAFNSLQKEHNFDEHGNLIVEMDGDFDGIDSEKLKVEFSFKNSGIAPRNDPSFKIEEVREYQVYVYPQGYSSHKEAKADGRQRAYFLFRPRWPDIESNSGKKISNPYDIEGFDVEVSGSNLPFSTYEVLLHSAVDRLKQHQGFKWRSPTYLRPEDFAPDRIHKSSNVVDAELYVRVDKDLTGKVYAFDGTLHKISLLLSDERSGVTKSVRDDRECPGFYHTATIGPDRIAEMIPGHTWAREHKHYHVKHPKAVEGGPLAHPKVGVSLQNSLCKGSPKYAELNRLERELDEALLNVLKWSDLPVRPDHQVYVPDDYFKVTGSQRFRKLLQNKLPDIESIQEQEVRQLVVAGNATETDIQVLDTLLTDGGQFSPSDLAEKIGVALSTIYKSIDRLDGMVNHRYGDVQLASQYVAQQVVGHMDVLRKTISTDIEGAIDALVRGEQFLDSPGSDPWSLWLSNWVENIKENQGEPDEIEFGFQPADVEDAKRLMREGAGKWAQVTGNEFVDFAREFVPIVKTLSGELWSPSRSQFVRELPGYKARYPRLV